MELKQDPIAKTPPPSTKERSSSGVGATLNADSGIQIGSENSKTNSDATGITQAALVARATVSADGTIPSANLNELPPEVPNQYNIHIEETLAARIDAGAEVLRPQSDTGAEVSRLRSNPDAEFVRLQSDSGVEVRGHENGLTPESSSSTSEAKLSRPSISDYQDPVGFLKAIIDFRKATEKEFSVHDSTRALRKVSPSLVSLVLKRKRKITLDRANEFSKLMQLNPREKIYFRSWISRLEGAAEKPNASSSYGDFGDFEGASENRQDVGVHILNDWINVYVKDCFQLSKVQKNPELIYQCLASHAEPHRIKKSFEFLLREGYLRRTMDGSIVVETNLAVANPQLPSKKIRQFHKGALSVAKSALEMFPPAERLANTLVVPLNPKSYEQLTELIQEFSEKLQEFAANNQEPGERLYQLILNLSPTGGKVE